MKTTAADAKRHGKHYTPTRLASFLAERVLAHVPTDVRTLSVLDPACGDGELLVAIQERAAVSHPRLRVELVGVDLDPAAVVRASERSARPGLTAGWNAGDFLAGDFLEVAKSLPRHSFDVVITNPPYVRTQHLGQATARLLAAEHGLRGRIDLTHPFVRTVPTLLRPGGVLGLLSSNRFLTTRAGANVRRLLGTCLQPVELYDLGDTKLFSAAVLPAVTIALNQPFDPAVPCVFVSAYEAPAAERPAAERPADEAPAAQRPADEAPGVEHPADEAPAAWGPPAGEPDAVPSLFDGLLLGRDSVVEHGGRRVAIRVGRLSARSVGNPWRVSHPAGDAWLARVESRTWRTFGDIAKIRVGIKTTADGVFIGDDWDELPVVPETELLLPLITHHDVVPWGVSPTPRTRVLYPYDLARDRCRLLDMTQYPRAMAYLEQNRARLAGRGYVLAAGREWFEIWVPQRPSRWAAPKLVFPDISDTPRFAYDRSGAVVNGDCYWISLDDVGSEDVACLMLAVANSELGCTFYDEVCGNRLYSGRRRWITQYVARLPVPDPQQEVSREIIRNVTDVLEGRAAPTAERCRHVSRLVEEAFDSSPGPIRRMP